MLDTEFKEFRAYELEDSGEKTEIEMEIENVREHFHSENVLLLVRFDLRRVFIWKGPKSPVRKRFISSRVGSKIQEDSSKMGVHLKIVSVDAGDEPIEFLQAFKVDSYEVTDEEKPEDMYYIRNDERRKMEEAEIAAKLKEKKEGKKGEYWSPALGTSTQENIEQAKQKAAAKARNLSQPSPKPAKSIKHSRTIEPQSSSVGTASCLSATEEKAILDEVLKSEIPSGFQRLNIVIGTSLYGPKKVISKVFGKEIESEQWDNISQIPEGKIDIDGGKLQILCKNNQIQGISVLQVCNGASSLKNTDTSPKTKKSSEKRELNPIPRG